MATQACEEERTQAGRGLHSESIIDMFLPGFDFSRLFCSGKMREPDISSEDQGGGGTDGQTPLFAGYGDRILWRTLDQYEHLLRPGSTGTAETLRESPHVPVYSTFTLCGVDECTPIVGLRIVAPATIKSYEDCCSKKMRKKI